MIVAFRPAFPDTLASPAASFLALPGSPSWERVSASSLAGDSQALVDSHTWVDPCILEGPCRLSGIEGVESFAEPFGTPEPDGDFLCAGQGRRRAAWCRSSSRSSPARIWSPRQGWKSRRIQSSAGCQRHIGKRKIIKTYSGDVILVFHDFATGDSAERIKLHTQAIVVPFV